MPLPRRGKGFALLSGSEVVEELKHLSVEHNIKLMNKFYKQEEFAGLLETARSEKQWKNLRTYISIFGGCFCLYDRKTKTDDPEIFKRASGSQRKRYTKPGGSRSSGEIIAHFNEEYKKELPAGVNPPEKEITNLSLWEGSAVGCISCLIRN